MKCLKEFLRCVIYLGVTAYMMFAAPAAMADPGGFWYGMYGTPTYTASLCELRDRYRMNYAYLTLNDSDNPSTFLRVADSLGIRILQGTPCGNGLPLDSALVFWYSAHSYLKVQAEPDTILYDWDARIILHDNLYPDTNIWSGTFAHYSKCDAALACSTCGSCCGGWVYDQKAENDSAWLFMPKADACLDSVFIQFYGDVAANAVGKAFDFRFQIRAEADSCQQDTLGRIVIRKNVKTNWWLPDDAWDDLNERYLICSDFPDSNYHTFTLAAPEGENSWLHAFVFTTGKVKIWVDWISVSDGPGFDIMTSSTFQNRTRAYAARYAYNDDPAILGYYLAEELSQDANVQPQLKVTQLVNEASSTLTTFTEHHYVEFWGGQRNTYGRRNVASARLQQPYGSPMSGIFYPFTGYHFEKHRPENPWAASTLDTILALDGVDTCITTDTSSCLQERLENVAGAMAMYRDVCDSLDVKFVPHLQSYSVQQRIPPVSCDQDTSPPWMVGHREPTEGETRVLASVALACGAQGLVYWVYGNHNPQYDTLLLACGDSTTTLIFQETRYYKGLVDLPGVQAGLANYVGPLVDSLGALFYDLDWIWSGRVDVVSGTPLIASVTSLTRDFPFAYIHAGIFKDQSGNDYLFLVNRRAYDTIPQDIVAWLNLVEGNYYIVDMYAYDTTVAGPNAAGVAPLATRINPGEGKLFKIIPTQTAYAPGHLTDIQWWSGDIRLNHDLVVDSTQSLTLAAGTQLRIAPNYDYVLDVRGDLSIKGTEEEPVQLVSADESPTAGDWYGILQEGPGDLSIEHASIKHTYRAISIDDTTNVLAASIRSCNIDSSTISGVMIRTNPASTVTVAQSTIRDGMYGVQVYEGYVTIDSCTFSGSLRDGIRIQGAWQEDKIVGGLIRGNVFEDMSYSAAKGVYLYGIEDDGRDYATEPLMQDNLYRGELTNRPGQVAYVIYDCGDILSLLRNAVDGSYEAHSIGYGYMTHGTQVLINGDIDSTEWKSQVLDARYAVYVYSSYGVSEHPVIRQMSLHASKPFNTGYSVWVNSVGHADVGNGGDGGQNVIWN